jgi:hypothetical protein
MVLAVRETPHDFLVGKQPTSKVQYHADDLGIKLSDNFDINGYENIDREGRIEYANQNVPGETIIEYQNKIGKAMTEDIIIIGKYKKDVDFKL